MKKGGSLEGHVALVTGSSRGIGKAIALRLAREGADVGINCQYTKKQAEKVARLIDELGEIKKIERLASMIERMDTMENAMEMQGMIEGMGRSSCVCQANVGDPAQVDAMVKKVKESIGEIDILINNAGIVRDKSFTKMTTEMWREVLSINLDGTFYCTKAVISGMIEAGFGRIVNISSVVGRTGNFGQANYAASKAGMIGLTMTLAREFARKGITVNAVAPGFIETEMLLRMPKEAAGSLITTIPMGRLGKPHEVAGVVAFLVSEDASYITGQVLNVNGGLYI